MQMINTINTIINKINLMNMQIYIQTYIKLITIMFIKIINIQTINKTLNHLKKIQINILKTKQLNKIKH